MSLSKCAKLIAPSTEKAVRGTAGLKAGAAPSALLSILVCMMMAGSCLSSDFAIGQSASKMRQSATGAPCADNFNVSSTHCPAKFCRETDTRLPTPGVYTPPFGETDPCFRHVAKTHLKKRHFPP